MTPSLQKADSLDKAAIFFVIVPFVAWIIALVMQFRCLKVSTYRQQVLSTRLGLLLPAYALILFFCVYKPSAYLGLLVIIAVIEAASFYTFFALIVANLGGPDASIQKLSTLKRTPICCGCCCPGDIAGYYSRVQWALFLFITVRVVFVIITAILGYKGYVGGSAVTSLISAGFVTNAFLTLIIFYEMAYSLCKNMFAVGKAFLMKSSVVLIVLQGLIEELLVGTGKLNIITNSGFTKDENGVRAYCFLVLLEFFLLSILLAVAFSFEITPPPALADIENASSASAASSPSAPPLPASSSATAGRTSLTIDNGSNHSHGTIGSSLTAGSNNNSNNNDPAPVGLCEYFCAVLAFWDIVGTLTPTGGDSDKSSLRQNQRNNL